MLSHLIIRNFTIIEKTNLELKQSMTAITGETGAGKSIILDALGLVLGDRADSKQVKHGQKKAEIVATFDIDSGCQAEHWLKELDLDSEDQTCLLRRILTEDGRSKAFINGTPCTLAQLKTLGNMLISIHGQHEHYALLKADNQLTRLDHYAQNDTLIKKANIAYQAWHTLDTSLSELTKTLEVMSAEKHLLEYQIEELDNLALGEYELENLHQNQQRLSHANMLLSQTQNCLSHLSDAPDQNILSQLNRVQQDLSELQGIDGALESIYKIIDEAKINLEEAASELNVYTNQVELDPEQLHQVENRLTQIHDIARKHQVQPEQLYTYHQSLLKKLEKISLSDKTKIELEAKLADAESTYYSLAKKLSDSRSKAAKTLAKKVTEHMQMLNMQGGKFTINLELDKTLKPRTNGIDQCQYFVTTNPGQPLQPIKQVVSGGELSRIGLIIQVLTSERKTTPTLIFDEIDVGISGPTAEIVGKLLKQLGQACQVLCITHLPQVAAQAENHLQVEKIKHKTHTESHLVELDQEARIKALAQMIGGVKLTKEARQHAKNMLV